MSPPTPSDVSITPLRTAERTPLLFTTNMGLEDVVVDEFARRCAEAGVTVTNRDPEPFGLNSYALVTCAAPLDDLLPLARRMRSVHHVLAPLYTFNLPATDPLDAIRVTLARWAVPAMEDADTFRVTSVRQGEHDFTSIDVQRVAGTGLQEQYDTEVDLEDYDAEVRVDVHHDRGLVSVQHTRTALSRRQIDGYTPRAALKANVAYALLHLAHLDAPPKTLLDPFCGSGTLLLEAAQHWPETQCLGADWNEDAVAGARTNAALAGVAERVQIRPSDARHLTDTFDAETADLIVTNPPFGIRLGASMNFDAFYRRVLDQMATVLRPEGRAVLLVLKQGPFNRALDATERFDVRHVRVIEIGGRYPRVFVLQKTAADG